MKKQPSKTLVVAKPTNLTTQEMENNGIKTSLSQNDIVDIIVEEKLNKIMTTLNTLQDDGNKLWQVYFGCLIPQVEVFLKAIGQYSIENMKNIQVYGMRNNGQIDVLRFSGDDNISVHTNSTSILMESTVNLSLTIYDQFVKEDSKTKIITNQNNNTKYTTTIIVTKKQLKPYLTFVDDYRTRVTEFMSSIPTDGRNGRINVTKITHEIKNKINKKILKDQAPLIMGQIEKLLDITL